MLGFGVFKVTDKAECKRAVLNAIRAGYRLIDTAAVYDNEDAVGEAVREAIAEGLCTREALFITSKLWVQDMANAGMAKAGIAASLKKSGLEYFDLYLLHQAMGDYFSAWRALEEAYEAGILKAIGVSNFYAHVLANFCETVRIKPMVNQVELHPYFAQPAALETMKHYHVQPEAWAPLGGGRHNPYEEAMLQVIADAHHKTIAQVILRWKVYLIYLCATVSGDSDSSQAFWPLPDITGDWRRRFCRHAAYYDRSERPVLSDTGGYPFVNGRDCRNASAGRAPHRFSRRTVKPVGPAGDGSAHRLVDMDCADAARGCGGGRWSDGRRDPTIDCPRVNGRRPGV